VGGKRVSTVSERVGKKKITETGPPSGEGCTIQGGNVRQEGQGVGGGNMAAAFSSRFGTGANSLIAERLTENCWEKKGKRIWTASNRKELGKMADVEDLFVCLKEENTAGLEALSSWPTGGGGGKKKKSWCATQLRPLSKPQSFGAGSGTQRGGAG